MEQYSELIDCARRYRDNAYAPYSGYKVGAAVMTKAGRLYGGCNIELASYTLTRHSEMVALDKAISEGEREFSALAVITDDKAAPFPCALCRQVMKEYCSSDFVIIAANVHGVVKKSTLGELYPLSFGPENLSD
jgi:cytidine deaminase